MTKQSDIQIARRIWESQSTNAIIDYVVVKHLPRNALVELQVWTHLGNDKFECVFEFFIFFMSFNHLLTCICIITDEETGCSIDHLTVLLKRRWNYESECSAGICTVSLRMIYLCKNFIPFYAFSLIF